MKELYNDCVGNDSETCETDDVIKTIILNASKGFRIGFEMKSNGFERANKKENWNRKKMITFGSHEGV